MLIKGSPYEDITLIDYVLKRDILKELKSFLKVYQVLQTKTQIKTPIFIDYDDE